MPLAPSDHMRTLAARRLTDEVYLFTSTDDDDVNPTTFVHTPVISNEWTGPALVHQTQTAWQPDGDRVFGLRELNIWAAATAAPTVGQRCTLNSTADPTLTGKTGTVIHVHRSSLRAVRRFTIRLDSDT